MTFHTTIINRMNAGVLAAAVLLCAAAGAIATPQNTRPYQELHIPELLKGTEFNLSLHSGKHSFWQGATTKTYSYNNEAFWGPTLELVQGQTVKINVANALDEPTTTHWHGLHVPAKMDGGPHQLIAAGKTWSPSFVVKNNAGTYWYHPHAHETTQKQLTYGAGGLIIIRDPKEAALNLPRNYGVDDIPLALTSRRFYKNDQFSFEGDNDKYGDFLLANGTLDARKTVPAQFIRLRILNGEIERGYNLGFRDNRTFFLITTDGGLVDKPIPLKRLQLMVGERAEILIDLTSEIPGKSLDLMAFNANHPFGYPGGEPGTSRPNGSYLNNIDFQILHLEIGARSDNPVLTLPPVLTTNTFPNAAAATVKRTINITADNPGQPFWFDNQPYIMHRADQIVRLGDTELWTINNGRIFGHSFHMHDVQFHIIARSSGQPAEYEQGWKDTVYVPRDEWVTVAAKFEDFASDTDAFMYHCHMANHEDGGLMAEFVVVKDPAAAIKFRDQQIHPVTQAMATTLEKQTGTVAPNFSYLAANGKAAGSVSSTTVPIVLTFIEKECPCSKDAAVYFNRLQKALGNTVKVVGVINSNSRAAEAWRQESGAEYALCLDPDLKLIKTMRAERSVTTVLLDGSHHVVKTWAGYSKDMLAELSKSAAQLTGTAVGSLDTTGAPGVLVSGCVFSATQGT